MNRAQMTARIVAAALDEERASRIQDQWDDDDDDLMNDYDPWELWGSDCEDASDDFGYDWDDQNDYDRYDDQIYDDLYDPCPYGIDVP